MAQSRGELFADAELSFQKAIQLQDALLAAKPGDAETWSNQGSVWNNLGLVFDQQKRFTNAEKAYQQAIANQRRALDSVPKNERYRALLSQHYLNNVRNLEKQAKYDAAVQAAVERKQLWSGNANRLYSAAQQLAMMYGSMRAASSSPQSQATCLRAAVDTLKESVAAGLPLKRLQDKSLAILSDADDFRKLIDEAIASATRPATAHQAAER